MSLGQHGGALRPTRVEVLAPFFRAIFRARERQQREWCYPRGPATVAVAGSDAIRILLIGDGPAAGCGVLTHELGVAGYLARHLAEATRRGVEVTVKAEPDASARSVLRRLPGMGIDGYDAIVLMLARTDALCLTDRRNWRRSMTAIVESLTSVPNATVIVTSTASVDRMSSLSPLVRRVTDRHARVLNIATSLICACFGAQMVSLDAARELAPSTYEEWGTRIGASISGSRAASR